MESVELEIDRLPDSNLKMKDMKKGQIAKIVGSNEIVLRQESSTGEVIFITLSNLSKYSKDFDCYSHNCPVHVELLEPGTVLNLKITV